MDFELRDETAADEGFLERLFVEGRAGEFAPLGLGAEQLAGLMAMQARAQRMGYSGNYPAAKRSVVWVEGRAVGRMIVDYGERVVTLVDVALLEEFRGRGIGGRLVEGVCREAEGAGKVVRLSVKRCNRAKNLYERAGFKVCGEDALQFEMEFCPRRDG